MLETGQKLVCKFHLKFHRFILLYFNKFWFKIINNKKIRKIGLVQLRSADPKM